jgi:hypothetical protein
LNFLKSKYPLFFLAQRVSRDAGTDVTLIIKGHFNPGDIHFYSSSFYFTNIKKLHISSLRVQNSKAIKDFLSAFPILDDLSITFNDWGSLIPRVIRAFI